MPDTTENSEIESQQADDKPSSMATQEFLRDLKKSGNQYIGAQSVLDALDLWNSSVKLYFDTLDYKTSADALNDWLSCPIGATCFFLGAAFISTFAYLGNGVAKSPDQSQLSKQADTYWPYLRDMLKGLKWTFKGTRSFMIVASVIGQYQLIQYLTPAGLGLGVLSACNRMWNRGMVETRKILQVQNDAFRRQVKGIHACFHEVTRDLVWDEDGHECQDVLKNIYAGSILKVPSKVPSRDTDDVEYYRVHLSGKLERLEYNPFFEVLNRELDDIRGNVPGLKIVPRIYWDKFENLLSMHSEHSDFFNDVLKDKEQHLQKLLDPSSEESKFIQAQAVFQGNSKKAFASAAFSGLLNAPYYFLGLLSMVVLPHTIFIAAVGVCSLFMILNIAAELYQETDYQRRLRISQLKADLVKTKRLLVIEWQYANLGLLPTSASTQELASEENHDDAAASYVYPRNYRLKTEIKNLLELSRDKHQPLKEILEHFLPANEATSLSKKTSAYIDKFFLDYHTSDDHLIKLGFREEHHRATLKHCIKIAKYEQDYYQQYARLNDQLRLSKGSVWWQGLRNGLVVFGAFNSLLMTIASMNALFGIGFTPMFFYVSIIAGLTLLFFTTLYTLLSVNPKEDNIADDQDCRQSRTNNIFVAASTVNIIDGQDIQASKNLLISEQSEVIRQLLSGFKKGIKFLQTLSVFLTPLTDNENILTKVCYISTGLVFSGFFVLKGLRGLMRVDDEEYKNSFIFNYLTGQQLKREVKLETPKAPETPKRMRKAPSIFAMTEELVLRRSSPSPEPNSEPGFWRIALD